VIKLNSKANFLLSQAVSKLSMIPRLKGRIITVWARYGIMVNALAPGFFETKMTMGTLVTAGQLYLDRCPLGRFGNDDDLKGVVVLLASDASQYITGQIIAVDGGTTII
jgi:gluconate 5-dehydrogenase